MKLDKKIIKALGKAVNEAGTQLEFQRISGIPQGYLTKYLSGKIKGITMENWIKLFPHIKKFLPKNFRNPFELAAQNPVNLSGIPDEKLVIELLRRGYSIKKN